MSRPAPIADRRVQACLAALLWLLGVEIGPGIHVAWHQLWGAHHHDGTVAAADEHERDAHEHGHHTEHDHAHDHGHGHHADVEPHEPADDHDDDHADRDPHEGPALESPDPHGAHSLAHRQLAIAIGADAMPTVATATFGHAAFAPSPRLRPHSRAPRVTRARGPPSFG